MRSERLLRLLSARGNHQSLWTNDRRLANLVVGSLTIWKNKSVARQTGRSDATAGVWASKSGDAKFLFCFMLLKLDQALQLTQVWLAPCA